MHGISIYKISMPPPPPQDGRLDPPLNRFDKYLKYLSFSPIDLFRRRLSAEGAKPESNKRWKTGSGHVCMYVCFSKISHDLEHLTNPKWRHVAP